MKSIGRMNIIAGLAMILIMFGVIGNRQAHSFEAAAYGKLPLIFEQNEGQTAAEVDFLARGQGYTLFLTGESAVLSLASSDETGAALYMNLVGANSESRPEGLEILPGTSNYFKGSDPAQWQTNITQYAKVRYDDAWPGIDVVYYGRQGRLEFDFVVEAGVNPDQIRMAVVGAEAMAIKDGALVMETPGGEVVQQKPVIYQEQEGKRFKIDGDYILLADNRIGFKIGAYDKSQTLVIDPVLLYSTLIGGTASTGSESVTDIELDADGNAYITGVTNSADFPNTTIGNHGPAGSQDAFVAKLSADGTTLIW